LPFVVFSTSSAVYAWWCNSSFMFLSRKQLFSRNELKN
jgi:prenyltransferase beta subunit